MTEFEENGIEDEDRSLPLTEDEDENDSGHY